MDAARGHDSTTTEVVFRLPAGIDAETVAIAGDFNDWSPSASPLEHGEDGSWSTTVRLPAGRHRFRYVIDGHRWENDWAADDYEPNDLGEDNSVKIVAGAVGAFDVADAEARAIAQETSADTTKPDGELVAPTTPPTDDRQLDQS